MDKYERAAVRGNELLEHWKAKGGMRAAINAKCIDCSYDPLSGLGTWRQQIDACPAEDCPLWPYRPRSDDSSRQTEGGKIRTGWEQYRRTGSGRLLPGKALRGPVPRV